jgi:thioredoxin-dependent peroxiredoxin
MRTYPAQAGFASLRAFAHCALQHVDARKSLLRCAPMLDTEKRLAPTFRAASSLGREVSLEEYRGKYVVLYFYPRSFTMGCTVETIAFREATDELRALGAEIIGVSSDAEDTQCRFASTHRATFPILADSDRSITRAYDVLFPVIGVAKRVTFLIDPEGFIVARFRHELLWKKHISDAIAFLKAQR